MNTILERLKEPSTYRGLTIIGALVGIHVSPDMVGAITSVAGGIIALIEVVRREKKQ